MSGRAGNTVPGEVVPAGGAVVVDAAGETPGETDESLPRVPVSGWCGDAPFGVDPARGVPLAGEPTEGLVEVAGLVEMGRLGEGEGPDDGERPGESEGPDDEERLGEGEGPGDREGLDEGEGPGDREGPGETAELGAMAGPVVAIVGEPAGPALPGGGAKVTGALVCAFAAGGAPAEAGAVDVGAPGPAAGASTGGATDDSVTSPGDDATWPAATVGPVSVATGGAVTAEAAAEERPGVAEAAG